MQLYTQQILGIAAQKGFIQTKELQSAGIPNIYLSRLVAQGKLEKVSRGLYRAPMAPITEHHGLAIAAARAPKGVVCLLSALSFHEITTQIPFEVWMALENKAWAADKDGQPLRYVRFSGEAFTAGIENHTIEGIPVKIYNPAKTVADCFKYRHKIGLDIAIEALKDGLNEQKFTVADLMHFAKICRVHNVMRPYIEAII